MRPPALTRSVSNSASIAQSGRAHIKLDRSSAWSTSLAILKAVNEQAVSGSTGAGSLKLKFIPSRAPSPNACQYDGGQPEVAPETYLCPPSMDRRSAVEGVLILALSFRSIVKHSSLTASFWTVSASLATWQKAMARWVLILRGIVQINHVIVGVIRHKLQCLGNGNA